MTQKIKDHLLKLCWVGATAMTLGTIYEFFLGEIYTAKILLFFSWVFLLIYIGVGTTEVSQ